MEREHNTFVIGMILMGLAACLFVAGCGDSHSEAEVTTGSAETNSGACIADTLVSGESLYTSLVEAGLEAAHVVEVLHALGEEVDLRSCKPGDCYLADVDQAGSVLSLCYHKGLTRRFKVKRDTAGYTVATEEVPLVRFTRRVEGVIETSLWEAFLSIGEDPRLALELADVLGWEIDFVTDPRIGDTFIMIFDEIYCENRKIGIGDVVGVCYVNQGEEFLAFGFPDEDGRMQYYDSEGNSVRRVFLKSPLNYRRISSHFSNSRYHPILKIRRPHHGVD